MPLPGSSPSRAASQPEAGVGGRQREDAEPQAGAGERPAHRTHRCSARAELLDHVGRPRAALAVAVVASTGAPGGQRGQQVADAPVVGPEVVAPVADAVRLVDDEQPGGLGQPGQLLVAEPRVVQPLRADQQQVDLVGGERGRRRRPTRRRWPS